MVLLRIVKERPVSFMSFQKPAKPISYKVFCRDHPTNPAHCVRVKSGGKHFSPGQTGPKVYGTIRILDEYIIFLFPESNGA